MHLALNFIIRISLKFIRLLPISKFKYNLTQKLFYLAGISNHLEHNLNPDYWLVLLGPLKNKNQWDNKNGLDFGCGQGRNIINIKSLCNFKTVDGVDISKSNILYLRKNLESKDSRFFLNNGLDLREIPDNYYDFVISTIVLQHIPSFTIRDGILRELYRVMANNSIISIQMGFGQSETYIQDNNLTNYYDEFFNAKGTNGTNDVRIT
jgi:SAM-dependent methyltransferase